MTSRTRLHLPCALIVLMTVTGVVPHCARAASSASPESDHALLMQLAARLNADENTIASLKAQLAARPVAAATPDASTTSYGPFTVTGKDVYLTGYNLHIQSGSGSTSGAVNGYGNLIIGYNEAGSSPKRTGSHNLILGTQNNYSSYGGIVAGNGNSISGIYASAVGGRDGTAMGSYSCISGGYKNTTSTIYTVAAGPMNVSALTTQGNDGNNHSGYLVTFTGANVQIVNGFGATDGEPNNPEDVTNYITNGLGNLIVGYNETQASLNNGSSDYRVGSHNLILGDYNEHFGFGGMVGGSFDELGGAYCGIVAGSFNQAGEADNAILGGTYNTTDNADYATVSGGEHNNASGISATVAGGESNTSSGIAASVTGGQQNTASVEAASISAGIENVISGDGLYSSISGGNSNTVTGPTSSISGGGSLNISSQTGWAAGSQTGNDISGDFYSLPD